MEIDIMANYPHRVYLVQYCPQWAKKTIYNNWVVRLQGIAYWLIGKKQGRIHHACTVIYDDKENPYICCIMRFATDGRLSSKVIQVNPETAEFSDLTKKFSEFLESEERWKKRKAKIIYKEHKRAKRRRQYTTLEEN